MFRPLTVIAITAFCVVGWNVYRAEDSARHLDREARDIARKIDQARERTQVLRAEWALLNEPERLRQVAQKYLPLETMQPTQFVRLGELDRRMPTAVAFAGPVSLFAPAPGQQPTALADAQPQAPTPANTAVAMAAPVNPAPRAVAPILAAAAPAVRTAPRIEPARTEPSRPELARVETPHRAEAPRAPVAAPASAPVTLAANRVEEPVRRRPAPAPRPQAATVREAPPAPREPQVAEARPASTGLLRQAAMHLPISSANAAALPAPVSGSALGGVSRGALAPPVPLPVPVPVR